MELCWCWKRTKFFLGKFGDSNLTERNSRRSAAGVFGVDCTSDGSDLKWPVSVAFGISRRWGWGVPLGDQIPLMKIHITHKPKETKKKQEKIYKYQNEWLEYFYRVKYIYISGKAMLLVIKQESIKTKTQAYTNTEWILHILKEREINNNNKTDEYVKF